MIFRLLLAAVALLGCARPAVRGPTAIYIDPAFTATERAAIADSAAAWTRATPECARFTVTTSPRAGIVVRRATRAELAPWGGLTSTIGGAWDRTNRVVWIDPTTAYGSGPWLSAIAAHELGHALGMSHHLYGIMWAVVGPSDLPGGEIPAVDVARARAACR